jgi:hypothetical protein
MYLGSRPELARNDSQTLTIDQSIISQIEQTSALAFLQNMSDLGQTDVDVPLGNSHQQLLR